MRNMEKRENEEKHKNAVDYFYLGEGESYLHLHPIANPKIVYLFIYCFRAAFQATGYVAIPSCLTRTNTFNVNLIWRIRFDLDIFRILFLSVFSFMCKCVHVVVTAHNFAIIFVHNFSLPFIE